MPFDGVGFAAAESLSKLDAVIDLLGTPDKWCKGTRKTRDGRYCLRGAILAAGAGGLLDLPIRQAINEVSARCFYGIEAFNDHDGTDYALICAVLSRTRDNLVSGKSIAAPRRRLRRGILEQILAAFKSLAG